MYTIYIFYHKTKPFSFIKLSRKGLDRIKCRDRVSFYMSLGNMLSDKRFSSNEYKNLANLLIINRLMTYQHPAGTWKDEWDYLLLGKFDSMEDLLEATPKIIEEAGLIKGVKREIINITVPWNRGTILRDMDGNWVGVIRPQARKKKEPIPHVAKRKKETDNADNSSENRFCTRELASFFHPTSRENNHAKTL